MIFRFSSVLCFSILLISCSAAFSQTTEASEKSESRLALEKQAIEILDKTVNEAGSLRLWENRAVVYAVAGDLFWDSDQKLANRFFRQSAEEMMNGVNVEERRSTDFYATWTARSRFTPRRTVLMTIAMRNAPLALELLDQTRPAKVQQAMNRANSASPSTEGLTPAERSRRSQDRNLVSRELWLEQAIATRAAAQDPKLAASMIRKSLDSGITGSVIELLSKVAKLDEELAGDLGGEVVDKITTSDLSNRTEMFAAQRLLREAKKPDGDKADNSKKGVVLDPSDLEKLASKLADYFIAKKRLDSYWMFGSVIDLVIKYAPSKKDILERKRSEFEKQTPEYAKTSYALQKIIDDKSNSASDLVVSARDYNQYSKKFLYSEAIKRAKKEGSQEDLLKMLRAESASPERDEAVAELDRALSKKAAKEGELDKVDEILSGSASEKQKLKVLIDSARVLHGRGDEDSISTAADMMEKAMDLVPLIPADKDDAESMLLLSSGLAEIDPARAFRYLSGLVVMANDLLMADALRAKYEKRSASFIEGEIIFTQHAHQKYSAYGKGIALLAEEDLDELESIILEFRRSDIRILLRLLMCQSILKGKIGFEGNRVTSYTSISYS